ncbi:MAG TPA: 50S ribosomal protein L29 [Verrucomicrobiae bacterium]|nr:50S ribosomal protein L29 [Verrucomicrobiae bacterium]
MDDHGLGETLEARRQELLQLRLQQATGQLEHHRRVREVRRDIARILTLQGERARELAQEA